MLVSVCLSFFADSRLFSLSLDAIPLFEMASNDSDDLTTRLQNLRGESSRPRMSLEELHDRVARLKGLDPSQYTAPPITVYTRPDLRTEHQKAEDLLAQIMAASSIDDGVACDNRSRDAQLESRLRQLQADMANTAGSAICTTPLRGDPDDETSRIVAEAVSRARLDSEEKVDEPEDDVDDEMDPIGCNICDEDADVVCRKCNNDFYCMACFKEMHSDTDFKKHRPIRI